MIDKRPDTFDDLFVNKKVYDHVSNRKDHLTDKLMDPAGAVLPLVRVYPQRDSTDKVLNHLDEWTAEHGTENSITEFSDYPPYVSFKLRNGTPVFSDYICVEYFRLYLIAPGSEGLKRYTYFEIYYDEYIVTCLMDMATFQRNGAMDCLDMDAKEWAYAKQQLKLWNQVIYPEAEELEQDSALVQRIDEYCNLAKSKNARAKKPKFKYDEDTGTIWTALAYLCSFQILDLLPPKHLPQYTINFVCESEQSCKTLSEKLTAILSVLFADDCYIKGKIPLHSDYQRPNAGISSPCTVRPYILRDQRASSIKELLADLNRYSHIRASNKKWAKHPFRYDVPICISNREIVDSVVLNIRITDQMIGNISAQNYPKPALLRFFCSLREKKDGGVCYCKRRKMEKRLDGIRKAARKCSNESQRDSIKQHRSMFHLVLILLAIHGTQLKKHRLPKNIRAWFLGLLEDWQTQDTTLESAVGQILKMATGEAKEAGSGFPADVDELEGSYKGICKTDDLLLYQQHCLETKLAERFPSIQAKDIITKLDEKGVLKKNKNVLTYSKKVGGSTVKFYALYLNKLEGQQ